MTRPDNRHLARIIVGLTRSGYAEDQINAVEELLNKYHPPTEDKKAPVDAETFLQSKDIWHHPMVMDRSHKTGYEIADLLTEHASNERTKAIQQCEDFIKDWYENERALEGKDFYTELSKLKK